MALSSSPLDTLRLANLCPASWESMVGDDRVRFCPACQLHVYNLSAMSRDEAEALLRQKEGRTCLHFYRRADGTVLTRDCPVGLRAARRKLGRVIGAVSAVLVALLTVLIGRGAGTADREDVLAVLRQKEPFKIARRIEPFKTVLEWLDPPPPAEWTGW